MFVFQLLQNKIYGLQDRCDHKDIVKGYLYDVYQSITIISYLKNCNFEIPKNVPFNPGPPIYKMSVADKQHYSCYYHLT